MDRRSRPDLVVRLYQEGYPIRRIVDYLDISTRAFIQEAQRGDQKRAVRIPLRQ